MREEHTFSDCGWTSCRDSCLNRAERRTTASFDLFYDRMAKSTALNFIVFSHYPTDTLGSHPCSLAGHLEGGEQAAAR